MICKSSKNLNQCCSKKIMFFITHAILTGIPRIAVFNIQGLNEANKGMSVDTQLLTFASALFISSIIRLASGYIADVYGHRRIPYMLAFSCAVTLTLIGISTAITPRLNYQYWKWVQDQSEASYFLKETNESGNVLKVTFNFKYSQLKNEKSYLHQENFLIFSPKYIFMFKIIFYTLS